MLLTVVLCVSRPDHDTPAVRLATFVPRLHAHKILRRNLQERISQTSSRSFALNQRYFILLCNGTHELAILTTTLTTTFHPTTPTATLHLTTTSLSSTISSLSMIPPYRLHPHLLLFLRTTILTSLPWRMNYTQSTEWTLQTSSHFLLL